jgi:plastocyanin
VPVCLPLFPRNLKGRRLISSYFCNYRFPIFAKLGKKVPIIPEKKGIFRGISIALLPVIMLKRSKVHRFALVGLVAAFILPASSAPGYEEIAVQNGGSIRGAVRVEGKLQKPAPLQVSKFKNICRDVSNESLVVGPEQGLRYAVITLEGISKGKAVEREAVHELDNAACRFVPHVQTASVGQFLLIKNSDPILHTAHAYFKDGQPQFNVGLYPGRVSRKPLVSPGVVKILCEVHPWMSAYIVVTEHPYHAVTDIYGDYLISGIPPGKYTVKVWHESLGTQEKQVEVKASATTKLDFRLVVSPGEKK